MKTVEEMNQYILSRSTDELTREYALYKPLFMQGVAHIFVELLAVEIDRRMDKETYERTD